MGRRQRVAPLPGQPERRSVSAPRRLDIHPSVDSTAVPHAGSTLTKCVESPAAKQRYRATGSAPSRTRDGTAAALL